jgi:beta-N-acetylhexosaminidase
MIGHISVPAIEPDPNRPASISPLVVTGLLKKQLGFHGLVVTDALDMGALMHAFSGTPAAISGAEAVEAVRAGNDMVIIPADLGGAYNGLLDAVKQGKITEQRIDESVLKILLLKASVGLNQNRFVDLPNVAREVTRPESQALAQKVADRAVTLATDANRLVPLHAASTAPAQSVLQPSGIVTVVFADSSRGSDGDRTFVTELRKRIPHATVFNVDPANAASISSDVLAAVKRAPRVIAVVESVPSPRRITQGHAQGSVGMDTGPSELLADIVKTAGANAVVVAFGNPYIGAGVAGIQTYLCTFSNTSASASSLAAALFGEIPIHGRLPVTIPGVAQRGTGLDRESVASGPVLPRN